MCTISLPVGLQNSQTLLAKAVYRISSKPVWNNYFLQSITRALHTELAISCIPRSNFEGRLRTRVIQIIHRFFWMTFFIFAEFAHMHRKSHRKLVIYASSVKPTNACLQKRATFFILYPFVHLPYNEEHKITLTSATIHPTLHTSMRGPGLGGAGGKEWLSPNFNWTHWFHFFTSGAW